MRVGWDVLRLLGRIVGGSLALFPTALATAKTHQPIDCRLNRSEYSLRGNANFTAGFVDSRLDQANTNGPMFFFRNMSSLYWFTTGLPGSGSGISNHFSFYGRQDKPGGVSAIPLEPVSLDVLAADASYNFNNDFVFASDGKAPQHIFITNLQEVMWYDLGLDKRVSVPIAFFDLISCDAP